MLTAFTKSGVRKVKLIVNMQYDDKEFIVRCKNTLMSVKEIWCVYKEYCVMEGKNDRNGKLVKEYHGMVEYHVGKLVKYCNVILKRNAMKELVMIMVGYVCVFDAYVLEGVEGGAETKYEQIKNENVNALRKIEVLL